jgi:hypothetical protein
MKGGLLVLFPLALVVGACADSGSGTDTSGRRDVGPIQLDYGSAPDGSVVPDFGPDALQCEKDGDCPGELPYCNQDWGVCVECRAQADCSGRGFCVDGKCETTLCQPRQKWCFQNVAKVCSDDGMEQVDTDCGSKACYEGECLECRPGSVDCPEFNKARFCRLDGSGWNETDCEDRRCVNGMCVNCVPGARSCQGSSVMRCTPDGAGIVFEEDCDTENTGRLCHLGTCVNLCEFNAKFKSNNGCEYWAVDLDQYYSSEPGSNGASAQFALVVSNTNQYFKAGVTITGPAGFSRVVEAPPKTATVINLPPLNIVSSGVSSQAYRLQSTLPIVAYQFNPLENVGVYSNDASLLLPTTALGKKYIVLAWPTIGLNSDAQILASTATVIAVESGETKVTVKTTAKLISGKDVPGLAAGSTYVWTLQQGQVLNLEAEERFADMTGSEIEADKPIAVFGGHVCANAPVSRCVNSRCSYDQGTVCATDAECPSIAACDHLEEQLPPTSAWGKRYIVPKSFKRGKAPDVVRVIAAEDGTTITAKPALVTIPALNKGRYHEFEISEDVELVGTKPFLVGQYLEGQNAPGSQHSGCYYINLFGEGDFCEKNPGKQCDCYDNVFGGPLKPCTVQAQCSPDDANTGDPSFMIGVPVEQFRKEYVFLVPPKYSKSYISIVARANTKVRLNGIEMTSSTFRPLAGGDFMVGSQPMSPGSHTLSTDEPAGLIVYGWDWYVSYGYPGGMNIETLQVYQ